MAIHSDLLTNNNQIVTRSFAFNKFQNLSTNAILGRSAYDSGSVEMLGAISIVNSPPGTIIHRNYTNPVFDTIERINDWNLVYNHYFPLNNTDTSTRLVNLSTSLIITSSNPNKIRSALSYNGTSWQTYNGHSNFAETSSNGSTFSTVPAYKINMNGTLSYLNYYCNYKLSKVVIGLINNCTSYVYSNDMINYTKVDTAFFLSTPVISGNVYSFWNSTTSQRVYTTDHVTYTPCNNFGESNLAIFEMSNNWLYFANTASLKISTNDGITWTDYVLPSTASSLTHCLDTNGTNHIFGGITNTLWSTTDFVTWNSRASGIPSSSNIIRVYNTNGTFFVFSNFSSTASFSTSTDGITWNNRITPNAFIGNDVTYVNSLYMILGTNRVFVSSNLTSWTSSISAGNNNLNSSTQTFYGSGSKASTISSNNWYFYNSGVWTSISNTQGVSGVSQPIFEYKLNKLIKITN